MSSARNAAQIVAADNEPAPLYVAVNPFSICRKPKRHSS
jgi:hypothetical protein